MSPLHPEADPAQRYVNLSNLLDTGRRAHEILQDERRLGMAPYTDIQ